MVVGIGKDHIITTSCNYLRHIHIHIHYNARKKLRNYEILKQKINMISKRFADISQIHFFFFFCIFAMDDMVGQLERESCFTLCAFDLVGINNNFPA